MSYYKLQQVTLLMFLLLVGSSAYGTTLDHGPSKEVLEENNPKMLEMYRIRIWNDVQGTIEVSQNEGISWETAGKVIRPTIKVSRDGYTASKWVDFGRVAATAVNAIHINVGHNDEKDRGIIFSIIPKEFLIPPGKDYYSYMSPDSSIQTDIPAGDTIFGGGFSPFVGNKVFLYREGIRNTLEASYVPKAGDIIEILVERPVWYPVEMRFENRFGGLITLKYPNGEEKYIGQVLKPIVGVGRFLGTTYADTGRIRANHAGVICVSTSRIGELAGFQIIPANHGMSSEMVNARVLTQWMVISPISALDPSIEGVAPFFSSYIQPRYREDDLDHVDWYDRILKRFLVQVRIKNGDWQTMPHYSLYLDKPLPGWANNALQDVTHIRILFPRYK